MAKAKKKTAKKKTTTNGEMGHVYVIIGNTKFRAQANSISTKPPVGDLRDQLTKLREISEEVLKNNEEDNIEEHGKEE